MQLTRYIATQYGHAANNSFKSTPHRGVNSVLCATLHAAATPLRGGLTQALGGMESSSQVVSKTPSDCSAAEIAEFIALVTQGGEVAANGLEQRVMAAAQLAFLLSSGQVAGVAALKSPNPHYRRYVASSSGVALPAASFPYELGWVFVASAARGNGHSQSLTQAVLAFAECCGVFATSRTDNVPMHRALAKIGFLQVGEAYVSQHGKHHLQLFTRVPPNNSFKPTPHRGVGHVPTLR